MSTEFWDKKYTKETFSYGDEPNVFLASQRDFLPSTGTAFIPADGDGRNGVWLAQQGFSVQSLDLSKVAVQRARKRAETADVSIDAQVGDLADYPLPENTFDCIASIFLHMQPPVRTVVHRKLWAALKPGGVLILEAYRPEQIQFRQTHDSTGGPNSPIVLYRQTTLRRDFSDGEFEWLADSDTSLDEGVGHQGVSATVQARIRKPADV